MSMGKPLLSFSSSPLFGELGGELRVSTAWGPGCSPSLAVLEEALCVDYYSNGSNESCLPV